MSRTATARTVALRDQLRAILRAESPLPLSTNEVLLRIANGGKNCNSTFTDEHRCPREACSAWCWQSPVYPQLVALMRLGLVERIRPEGMRRAYWRYVGDHQADASFNAVIERLVNHE